MRRLALLLAALAAAGCAGPPPPQTAADLEPGLFTLGYAAVTARDRELARAAELAVELVNEGGGVDGAVRIELVIDAEGGGAAETARRLVLRGVQALVLACDPEHERAQAEIADRAQVLAFAPCNDDPRIPLRYPIVWPVSLAANAEAAALADHALAEGYASFRAIGLWSPMRRYVGAAAATRDLELASDADVTLGTHRVEDDDLADGVAFTTYGFPSPGTRAKDFYELYARRLGQEPRGSWVALGYDAVRVLVSVMQAAGSADPFDIQERLASGMTAQGAYGEIVYPGAGVRQPEVAAVVVRVEEGRRVLVEKSLPEEVPAP